MIVAGIGCRKGVSSDEVIAAIEAAALRHKLGGDQFAALATVAAKASEKGISEAARQLSLELVIVPNQALEGTSSRQLSRSALSLAATGAASASEAAALAAAGPTSRLLGPRIAVASVTCAIAVSGDDA